MSEQPCNKQYEIKLTLIESEEHNKLDSQKLA